MSDPSASFGNFQDPNQLLRIPKGNKQSLPAFSDPNQFFQSLGSGNVNFLMNQYKIYDVVLNQARKKKQIVYGAQAMNRQLPLFFQRPTEDYDVHTNNPKAVAHKTQSTLDREVSGGRDEFFSKPALHPGTHKVMHVGKDMKPNTEDDIGVADYTEMPKGLPTVTVEGIRYEKLSHIKERKKEILKDPESKYRHEKDREDIRRIEESKSLRGVF